MHLLSSLYNAKIQKVSEQTIQFQKFSANKI
nr:MAG TPA: hypothetical protein [Caudoviricetes sp.]